MATTYIRHCSSVAPESHTSGTHRNEYLKAALQTALKHRYDLVSVAAIEHKAIDFIVSVVSVSKGWIGSRKSKK